MRAENLPTYTVRRSNRARRLRIRVSFDGVELVLPRRATLEQGRLFVASQLEWIERQLARMAALRDQRTPQPADTLLLGGVLRPLILTVAAGTAHVHIDAAGAVCVSAADPHAALQRWLRHHAADVLSERTRLRSAEMGRAPARLFFREQRSRWGSCSANGNISFHWRLIHAPHDVLDYVVVHELAHLHEFNHSPRFWARVAAHCPDYLRHMQWLRSEGWRLRSPSE